MNEGRQHQRRGTVTEAVVTGRLLRHGFGVSKPAFGNERYDLILDDDGTLQRVQVKTAYPHNQRTETAVVEFDTTVYGSDGTAQRSYYSGDEIDAYVVYSPEQDIVLYVPFEDAPETQMNFSFRDRSSYNRHNQKAVNFAAEYRLDARG